MEMAVTYEDVVAILEARIRKKRKEIRELKAELKAVQIEKNKDTYQRLMEYVTEHNIPPDSVFRIREK